MATLCLFPMQILLLTKNGKSVATKLEDKHSLWSPRRFLDFLGERD